MADYAMPLHTAAWRFPLRAALALVRPRAERLGHDVKAPDQGDTASLRKRKEVRTWLAERYHLVPALPAS